MHRRAARVWGTGLSVVMVWSLLGCDGAGRDADVGAAPSVSAAATTAVPRESDTPPATLAPTATPGEEELPTGAAGECPVGEWELDQDTWVAGMEAMLKRDLNDVEVQTSGGVSLSIAADGRYSVTARDGLTVSTGEGQGGTLRWELLFDGTEAGTWTLSGDELTLLAPAGERLQAQHEVTIDGQPLPADALGTDGSPWSETLSITCEAAQFTAIPVDEPDPVPVTFVRAATTEEP